MSITENWSHWPNSCGFNSQLNPGPNMDKNLAKLVAQWGYTMKKVVKWNIEGIKVDKPHKPGVLFGKLVVMFFSVLLDSRRWQSPPRLQRVVILVTTLNANVNTTAIWNTNHCQHVITYSNLHPTTKLSSHLKLNEVCTSRLLIHTRLIKNWSKY